MQSPGTLYIVSTPIGNLEDITLRALRVLKEVDVVAAEDTRHTIKLLAHFEIRTPLIAYHQHSEAARTANLVDRMREGQSIALVTDAGTPGISDPGCDLIDASIAAGIPIVPIPGASAVLTALVASGLKLARFTFEGFLPRAKSTRRAKLTAYAAVEMRTMVFYEAGNRTAETLADMTQVFGPDRQCCVGRELTKKHEQFLRGPLADVARQFKAGEQRGEITIAVAGLSGVDEAAATVDEASIEDRIASALRAALASGASERDAVKQVTAELKQSKRDVYAAMLSMKSEAP